MGSILDRSTLCTDVVKIVRDAAGWKQIMIKFQSYMLYDIWSVCLHKKHNYVQNM